METVVLSRSVYEELIKYKALYENEKSHSETLSTIISKLVEDIRGSEISSAPYGEVMDLGSVKDNIEDSIDYLPRHWLREQREDIAEAVAGICTTLEEHFK